MPMPFRDKTGQTFGYWTVLAFAGRDGRNATVWKCKCVCGMEKNVVIGSLTSGKSKSCGCKQYEITASKNTKHGMAGTPTYKSWHAMIQRVEGKGGHESYVKRKIDVCNEWLDFNNFFSDMGSRPVGKTLDRIDNSKGYSKDNCRWATYVEQANNRNNNVLIDVFGEKMTVAEAAKKFNMGISMLRHRLRKGLSPNNAVSIPHRTIKK